jgi:hypothetical protein
MAVVSAIGHQAGFRIIRRLTRWTPPAYPVSLRMEQTLRVITIECQDFRAGWNCRMELLEGALDKMAT